MFEKILENKVRTFACLIFPAFLIYFKSLYFDFTALDEQWQIVNNTAVLSHFGSLKNAFLQPISGLYYRPLCYVSIFIDYQLGHTSPFIFHLSNLLLHLFAVILVYIFFVGVNIEKKAAFISALIFSVHPILLHSVAWVVGRNDLLLCVFTLLSLIYFNKHTLSKRPHLFVFHLVFFVCALLTKENAIVLPFLFIATHVIANRINQKKLVLWIVCWFTISATWYAIRHSVVGGLAFEEVNMFVVIKNFCIAFLLFIGKALFATQQSIMPTLAYSSIVPGVLAFFLIVFLCFFPGLKNKTTAFYGLFFFFILLVIPVWFGVVKTGNEHYESRIYTSMVGMLLFFSQLKFNWESKKVMSFIAIIFLAYCFKTDDRMNVYRNRLSFAEAGIKESPDYYLFYLHKADWLLEQKQFSSAITFYDKAIIIRPNYALLYSNRGFAQDMNGNTAAAVSDYDKAIELSTVFEKKYYLNRCLANNKIGNAENAMKDLFVLIACCRDIIPAGVEKEITSKWIALVENLNTRIGNSPKDASLFYKRAKMYLDIDMKKEATQDLEKACMLDPDNSEYQRALQLQKKL